MRWFVRDGVKVVLALVATSACQSRSGNVDWPAYLGGLDSSQYSSLEQITAANVSQLELAWRFHSGDADPENRSQNQCNPIVIDGVLYATTPGLKLVALDAATGELRWDFDPFDGNYTLFGLGVNRGVMYWRDGTERRILYTAGQSLYAVDAASGTPIPSFGTGGAVDLHVGLGDRAADLFVSSNTPGVVFQDLVILGHRASEALPSAPGHIRAFDVRSGELVWTFHTIPQPSESGYETWPPDAHERTGGANNWAGMSLDPERGVVYVPTGSAAYDFYGGDRPGENLYANTLLALDGRTGEKIWHYQMVHHDIWDRDLPAPPNLVTLERDGRRIDAVAQITKTGHVFVLDRDTGEPLFPVEEHPVPASQLDGEVTWPTQPLPLAPPPFARQAMTEDDVTNLTAEKRAWARERLRRLRAGAPFTPPSREGSLILPGYDGGGEWGGAAFDETDGVLYVNASEMPWVLTMVELPETEARTTADLGYITYATHCLYCHGPDRQGDVMGEFPAIRDVGERWSEAQLRDLLQQGMGFMPSFAHLSASEVDLLLDFLVDRGKPLSPNEGSFVFGPGGRNDLRYTSTGYHRWVDEDGYPAIKPPWGTLSAIDLNQGDIVWQVPLGELPELTAKGIAPTGTENYGGPLVTAGGVIFIAATKDEKFRAFDKNSGELLWETSLPAGGYATPATYAVGGRQMVVIAAGGGKMGTKSGDAYLAFALPSDH